MSGLCKDLLCVKIVVSIIQLDFLSFRLSKSVTLDALTKVLRGLVMAGASSVNLTLICKAAGSGRSLLVDHGRW